jgi:hypothetical protein
MLGAQRSPMDCAIQLTLFLLAVLILPLGYARVLVLMKKREIARPPKLPFFFLFGTLGGWIVAYLLSPSGLAALCMAALATAAPLALLASSALLATRPERTSFHRFAMWAGFAYCSLQALGVLAGIMHN